MKRIHDITAVLRGVKIVQEVYCKNVKANCKTCLKALDDIEFSKKREIIKDIDLNAKTLLNGLYLIFHETCTVAKYRMRPMAADKDDDGHQPVRAVDKGPAETAPARPANVKADEAITRHSPESELDPIDKELIEEFRQQHPDIIRQSVESPPGDSGAVVAAASPANSATPFGHERKVPTSEIGRALSFASLFVRVGVGAVAESTRRQLGRGSSGASSESSSPVLAPETSPLLSEANAERIVEALCRVRGAALKLGQMLSIQDNEFVSAQLQTIFQRVRQNADFMPVRQMRRVLHRELGPDWRAAFSSFEETPFAAASIGQVHRAVLPDGAGGQPRTVAVKIQYPGIRTSIDSDINNLMSLLRFVKALPPGLHADKAIEVAKRELAWECDYIREAQFVNWFADKFRDDPVFAVPRVVPHLSTERVLTTEYVAGVSLDKCVLMDQATRDWIGSQMMRLCLTELFKFRTMQTDPNWANFLFDAPNKRIYLIDFGSSREYRKSFVDDYLHVIKSAAVQDKPSILKYSRKLGFLTGFETQLMEQAHIDAVSILGEVFTSTLPFDFGRQSTTKRIKALIPIMLEHRLTSPPEETYSLHRKLAGGFLLCSKLRSRVSCARLFDEIYEQYEFD